MIAMSSGFTGDILEYSDETAAVEDIEKRNWSDGLPVVMPTVERVSAMLEASSAPPDEMLGLMPTHWHPAYVHHVAVNAVMAGCAPAYFPVVLAAVRAVLDERFNLYGVQGTTNPCGAMLIVNGPIRDAIGLNYSHNLFGQGNRANATIGRAVRLCLVNIGGGRPKSGDMSTLGNPNKYGSCIAEDEASSPWEPLHVSRGFDPGASTVTVHSATAPLNVITMSDDGEAVINMLAGALATPGGNAMFLEQEIIVVLSPTQATRVARGGYSRSELERELWLRGRWSLEGLAETDERAIRDWRRTSLFTDNGREYVHPTASADLIGVVVAGGEGPHSAVITGFNGGRTVTVGID
jgi:hypothetical protein